MYLLPESEEAQMKQILEHLQSGVHTFEISQTLTKKQFQEVRHVARFRGKMIPSQGKQESYTMLDKEMPGITVTLHRLYHHRTYRVNVKIEPCRVLGSDDPTDLYRYSKESYQKLQKGCDRYLKILRIPGGMEDMPVSRCDLTCNLIFENQDYVDVYLRILKKSRLIPGYKVDRFCVYEKKAKNPIRANKHSHCIRCKQASLLCYDKIDQLKMDNRCPHELEAAAILRLEAQLKRPALKRTLGKDDMKDNQTLLKAASRQAMPAIQSYLARIFPCRGLHLRYRDAVSAVEEVGKEKLRQQMGCLIRKMSDAASWDSAAQKLRTHYKNVSDKREKVIYSKFDALDINPITLPNSSSIKQVPSLIQLIEDS